MHYYYLQSRLTFLDLTSLTLTGPAAPTSSAAPPPPHSIPPRDRRPSYGDRHLPRGPPRRRGGALPLHQRALLPPVLRDLRGHRGRSLGAGRRQAPHRGPPAPPHPVQVARDGRVRGAAGGGNARRRLGGVRPDPPPEQGPAQRRPGPLRGRPEPHGQRRLRGRGGGVLRRGARRGGGGEAEVAEAEAAGLPPTRPSGSSPTASSAPSSAPSSREEPSTRRRSASSPGGGSGASPWTSPASTTGEISPTPRSWRQSLPCATSASRR